MTKGPYQLFVLLMISTTWAACSVPFANPFPNTAKSINSFSFENPATEALILQDSHEITLTVPWGTDVTALVPRITYDGISINPAAGVAQNFTNPVVYRVTSATGAVQTYRVTVKMLPSATKGMTGFRFSMAVGMVDESTRTVRVTVPSGTNLTDLVPTITSNGVSVSPASGVAQDFTHPVTYTVRAADGTSQAYVVIVTMAGSGGLNSTTPATVTIDISGSSTLDDGSTMVVTATPSATVDSYAWYLDGSVISGQTASSVTIGSGLATGPHTLTAAVKKSGVLFASSFGFSVRSVAKVTTLAGSVGSTGSSDGTGAAATFMNPIGITTDGTNLYVAETGSNTIRKIVIGSGVVTTLAGGGSVGGSSSGSANGTGTTATFKDPIGITTDGTNLYVADYGNYLIRKIVISSGVVTTLAGGGSVGGTASGYTDGPGTTARFGGPYGITTDGTNLYVADYGNHLIRKIVINSGVVSTLAGGGSVGGTANGNADGTATAATFKNPIGITTDGTNLYVADYGNNLIRKIVISSRVVSTLAGGGSVGGTANGSSDGTGRAALLNRPYGITTDGTNLYVADYANNLIRKVVIGSGVVTTPAGGGSVGGTASGSADGTGTAATFRNPVGVATDGTKLYVVDTGNNTIRTMTKD